MIVNSGYLMLLDPASGDTATPEGLAEEAKAERGYRGTAPISFLTYYT